MSDASPAAIALRAVSKNYHALRPLRVAQLDLAAGESLALMGLDAVAAEVLVSLVTGATLPDAGTVHVLGQNTADITNADEWLKWLEQFGLMSDRSVLVDELTGAQNLALPFSLEVEDLSPRVRQEVDSLAAELGLSASELTQPAARLPELTRMRIRLGRAVALKPRILLAEHPNAMLSADDTPAFAADLSRTIAQRQLTALVITANATFASAVGEHVATLQPSTGAVKRAGGWRRWFA